MHRSPLAAIALLLPAALAAQAPAAPVAPARNAGTQLLGADGELRFGLAERGTALPIRLELARTAEARRGREKERAAGAPTAALRIDHAAARAWVAQADSLFGRMPAKNDSLVAALPVEGGRLTLVRLAGEPRRGRFLVHLTEGASTATAMADSAEAWAVVNMVRGAGELLDPAGQADPQRTYAWSTEVDKPALPSPASCKPRTPEEMADVNRIVRVQVEYVVTPAGAIDEKTFRVVRSGDGAFERVVRDAVPCMRFFPAEVRGEKVRMRMEQTFVFDVRQGS